MRNHTLKRLGVLPALFTLLLIVLVGCATASDDVLVTEETDAAVEVPPEVLRAQQAALDFLREAAYASAPPAGVPWDVTLGGDNLPAGFVIYFFTSSDSVMTVSYPDRAQAETLYHVSVGVTSSKLCWQANVDEAGHILETGAASETSLGSDNPAALYCEAQGYEYAVHEEPSGGHCGVCIFSDGSICNGWAYLRGQCQPGDRPADPPAETGDNSN